MSTEWVRQALWLISVIIGLDNGKLPHLHQAIANLLSSHWGWDKMATNFLKTFLNAFSSMKIYGSWLRFHLSLFSTANLALAGFPLTNALGESIPSRH